jgi:hypothetical protein
MVEQRVSAVGLHKIEQELGRQKVAQDVKHGERGCVPESDAGSAQKDDRQPSEQNQGGQLDNGVALDAKQVSVHATASGLVPRSKSSLPKRHLS